MLNMELEKLHKIDEDLETCEIAALKFLCMDKLGKKRLEKVKDAKGLFVLFREQNLFEDELLLHDLLYTIGRSDLLPILGTDKRNVMDSLQRQQSGVSEYRKMLYKLSEDVTDENLHNIKFLLNKLPKAKMQTATFLDVLDEMEKKEMLGEDNLDELEDVLRKCSIELACKVEEFKNSRTMSSIQGQEEGFAVPHQEESVIPQDMMQNISIAETEPHNRSSMQTEISVDTDAQEEATVAQTIINGNDYYPMTHRPLGYCLIINNHKFENTSDLKNRDGTNIDKDALTDVFQRMHFSVEDRGDLASSDIMDVVKKFAEKDHSNMDAFVCCILSHGEKGTVFGIDGESVQIRDLTQLFAHCRSLTGKPKLFFIQACQGRGLQQGVWKEDGSEADEEYEDDAEKASIIRIPIEADFLIGMATVQFYKSFRHTADGSIYIQELCRQLRIGCPIKEDILSILTKVNCNVSVRDLNGSKQMPEPRYTLTKKLVLPMD